MNESATPLVTQPRTAKRVAWLIVAVTILFVALVRGRLLNTPLERDEGEYSYAGQLILQGIPPYKLAYNMKLPGTYYAYAAGMAVFGQTPAGIHLTLIVVNALAVIFVFLLGRKLFGAMAGAYAAASYGLLSLSPAVLGMAAHANHFVVLFVLPATLLLWSACRNNRLALLFLAGWFFGMAFLMKQQAVFFGLFGLVFLAWTGLKHKSPLPELVKRGAVLCVAMILPFVLLCLLMWRAGVFDKFWFWTFTYARSYATSISLSEGVARFSDYVRLPLHLSVYIGFCALAIAGLVLARNKKSLRQQMAFLLLFAGFAFLATATGLYFRQHYFIQVLPALALLVGAAIRLLQHWLEDNATKRTAQILPALLFVVVAVWNIYYQRAFFFQLSPTAVIRAAYPGEHFAETVPVAEYIRDHTTPGDTIAVVGSEPQIYFNAQRHSGTGYIYTYALMELHPHAVAMQREMEGEIEQSRPKYLVDVGYDDSWAIKPESSHEIFDWFVKYAGTNYERVGLVDLAPMGTRYLWDDAARDFQGDIGHYLAIYKRKAD